MIQTYMIIALCLVILGLAVQTAKAWQTAKSLKQLIEMGPQVCEICATKASSKNHQDPHEGGNGGLYFADTHQYVPAQMVFLPPATTFIQTPTQDAQEGR